MHPIEEQIIALIEESSYISSNYKDQLYALPLGNLSPEFYKDLCVRVYCTKHGDQTLSLRLALEEYIGFDRLQPSLKKIEVAVQKLSLPLMPLAGMEKAGGSPLRPITNELRQIYLLNDQGLTHV